MEQVVFQTANIIQERATLKKNFGTLIVPEGLILQLPHYREMVTEVETLLGPKTADERVAFANALAADTSLISKTFSKYVAIIMPVICVPCNHCMCVCFVGILRLFLRICQSGSRLSF